MCRRFGSSALGLATMYKELAADLGCQTLNHCFATLCAVVLTVSLQRYCSSPGQMSNASWQQTWLQQTTSLLLACLRPAVVPSGRAPAERVATAVVVAKCIASWQQT
jgi:hypothetical protein